MTDRRFTDKEVALILRRAADLEKRSSTSSAASARGLTLEDLKEIAREAGIDPDLVGRAVAELESPKGLESTSLLAGPGVVRREVRAIPKELSKEELADILRIVDTEVADQGTIAEALGTVRWTGKGRFLSTQVSLEPAEGETLLRVEERYNEALRGILHGLPAAYALMFSLVGALEGLSLSALPGTLFVLGATGLGWTLGSSIWRTLSARSRTRVQKLAERLGLRGRELASVEGPEALPPPSGGPE